MSFRIEVWGEYACFSRPEMKVERVSYDVMTPSAARGLLEAIYWHPGLHWVIDRIRIVNPIRFTNIRRNEITEKAAAGPIMTAANRDVRYVIEAHFEMTERANSSDNEGKFTDIMRRRIEKGQFYHQPCFGTREFIAHFKPCEAIPECPEELRGERDLGWMLLDMDYSDKSNIKPMFFRAILHDGVLEVPKIGSEAVVK